MKTQVEKKTDGLSWTATKNHVEIWFTDSDIGITYHIWRDYLSGVYHVNGYDGTDWSFGLENYLTRPIKTLGFAKQVCEMHYRRIKALYANPNLDVTYHGNDTWSMVDTDTGRNYISDDGAETWVELQVEPGC